MPKASIERQFPQEHGVANIRTKLVRTHKDTNGDGEVVCGPLLLQVSRGEVDGYPFIRKAKAGIADGRAHALTGLLYGLIGQTHYLKRGESCGDVDFDFDERTVQSDYGTTHHPGEHRD